MNYKGKKLEKEYVHLKRLLKDILIVLMAAEKKKKKSIFFLKKSLGLEVWFKW
jgi:hypothetical protein